MRETRLSGSVEGVVSNHDPYSDSLGITRFPLLTHEGFPRAAPRNNENAPLQA